MKLTAPKGFKDYLPPEALVRREVIGKITSVFKKFGFEPLETPTLEYEETLTGKYGEEEKLIYKFETPGGDKVALKYDQTVPLARVVAQYGPNGAQKLPMPFKRYQIQSAYRGENTQKGRYREFTQCDADVIGVATPLTDAEILGLATEIYKNLGLEVVIKINDRALLAGIETKYLAAIDKLNKVGETGVIQEMQDKGLSQGEAEALFEKVTQNQPTDNLAEIIKLYQQLGYDQSNLKFDPTLIRGLDYYTGLIMEVVLKNNPNSSSLCGGGRWDRMIGKFTGQDQPAVGFAVGLDRTIEAMLEEGVMDSAGSSTQVLVTIFSPELLEKSLEVVSLLRSKNIAGEVYLDLKAKLEKQLKYADNKGIPYVVILGPEEAQSGQVVLKNLNARTQEKISIDNLVSRFNNLTI
jgi:histidyl-tRNA synthetase